MRERENQDLGLVTMYYEIVLSYLRIRRARSYIFK